MKYLILTFIFLSVVSCWNKAIQSEPSPAIMRIGTAILTERELLTAVGVNASPEQKLNFIRTWSDKELAYQAAIENGLDKDEFIKQTIDNMIKGFLSVQFIQQEVGKAGRVEITADEVEKEFHVNQQNYVRKEPVVRVARIVTATRMDAWKAREGLTPENFRVRGNTHSLESIQPFDSIKFAPASDFNPSTFNTVFGSRVMSITLPISENDKYSIYLILGKEDAGSPALLEEVIDDVKRNVLTKKQNQIIRNIYENLRNRYDYSFDREYIANLEYQHRKFIAEQAGVE